MASKIRFRGNRLKCCSDARQVIAYRYHCCTSRCASQRDGRLSHALCRICKTTSIGSSQRGASISLHDPRSPQRTGRFLDRFHDDRALTRGLAFAQDLPVRHPFHPLLLLLLTFLFLLAVPALFLILFVFQSPPTSARICECFGDGYFLKQYHWTTVVPSKLGTALRPGALLPVAT